MFDRVDARAEYFSTGLYNVFGESTIKPTLYPKSFFIILN